MSDMAFCPSPNVRTTSDNGRLSPDDTALASACFQGRRVAEVAQQYQAGVAAIRE